jgi:peptidoglycan hydrolase-like protein with peptidoglycan-binding domain
MNTKLLSSISKSKLVVFGAAVLLMSGFFIFGNVAHATATTLYVDANNTASTSTPDGTSANPYLTIQAAIGAANSGNTISVAAGNYNATTTPITVDKALTINGANVGVAGNVTSRGAESIINGSVSITSSNVTIDGFTITNDNTSGIGIYSSDNSNIIIKNNILTAIGNSSDDVIGRGIEVISTTSVVDNIQITNNNLNDITSGKSNGIVSGGTSAEAIAIGWSNPGSQDITGLLIQNNVISNIKADNTPWTPKAGGEWMPANTNPRGYGAYGILLNHSQTIAPQILDNQISNLNGFWAHAIGLEGDTPNAVITGNIVTGLTDNKSGLDEMALRLESNPSATSTLTVTGNTLDGKALSLATSTVFVNSTWSTLNPDPNTYPEVLTSDGTYRYYGINAFSKIQDAINAVSDSGTINVAAGTYQESLVINSKSNLTIKSTEGAATTIIQSRQTTGVVQGIHVINSTGITIDGFTVKDIIRDTNGNIYSGAGGQPYAMAAILLTDSSNCTIKNNSLFDFWYGAFVDGETVSAPDKSGGNVIENNTIDGNNVAKIGVYVYDVENSRTDSTTISGNTIKNSYYGVYVNANAKNLQILNNTITGSNNIMLYYGPSSGGYLYTATPATQNSGDGISFGWSPYNVITQGNTISNFQNGLHVQDQSGDVTTSTVATTAYNNKITGNLSYGVLDDVSDPGVTVNATKNWWGTASSTEIEALISTSTVAYSPWYSDSGMTTLRYATTNDGTNASTTISSETTLTGTSTASGNVVVTADIPSGTTVTGDASWDGTLMAPTATTTTVTISGYDTTVSSAIAIGSNDSDLSFDQPVKLTFAGQTGKLIGWYNHAGTFSEITSLCDGASTSTVGGVALAANGSCKFNDTSDLIVWTRHFSTFVTYTATATPVTPPVSSGGGGGGSMMLPILINASSSVSTTVGVPVTVHITVIDQNGRIPSIQATLPAGATFSTTTMDLVWTPTAVGSVTATITANDLLTSTTKTITLQAVGSVPVGNGQVLGVSTSAPQGQVLGATAFNFTKDLKLGSQGDDVTELQNRLTQEGVYSGPITGYFGPLTVAGVKAYQAKHGISQVGTVGPLTRAQLNSSQVLGVSTVNVDALKTQIASLQAQLLILLQQLFQSLQSKVSH